MANLVDHAAHRGGILERAPPVHLIETEPDQRLLLNLGPPNGAAVLLNRNGLAGLGVRFRPGGVSWHVRSPPCYLTPLSHAASPADSESAEPSRRRATISLTFLPRRAATPRGFSCPLRASK